VIPILLAGLKYLEYRGYDSAGLAVVASQKIVRWRVSGKVNALEAQLKTNTLTAPIGIAHTRWATHGKPTHHNAHPQMSGDNIAVVHNGIIENYLSLRQQLKQAGYLFSSDTDTEVIAHQIHYYLQETGDYLQAVRQTTQVLEGSYALAVLNPLEANCLIGVRQGSPLVIGVGIEEYFLASDAAALIPVTQRIIFLEEGDIVVLRQHRYEIITATGQSIERPIHLSQLQLDTLERGDYRHYMHKEIFEQPQALKRTLEHYVNQDQLLMSAFGTQALTLFQNIQSVQIIACGTSYHAGLVARYWIERLVHIPCQVEVASEFRYRHPLAHPQTLVVAISQSGETADTLAALHEAKLLGFGPSVAICNVAESALVRATDMVFMTQAGPERGVASTKAFTTQLLALLLLMLALGRAQNRLVTAEIIKILYTLPEQIQQVLKLNDRIQQLAQRFADKQHALFLGRGSHYPIALEGALKLKEISYIHAEAYPAGELKHGPLALIDAQMPVIAVAPNDALQEKLKSNLQEVHARGGQLIIFANQRAIMHPLDYIEVIELGEVNELIS
ncbi:MAG: glutamine--fructose-6-phosphate transaminase (isomerizing), partial [Pseudomonadota bacterium]|nr:glutamine--fructose-6-phosphate transaminase (isomerizing) [Pseudomonadota bacterium]